MRTSRVEFRPVVRNYAIHIKPIGNVYTDLSVVTMSYDTFDNIVPAPYQNSDKIARQGNQAGNRAQASAPGYIHPTLGEALDVSGPRNEINYYACSGQKRFYIF